MDWFSPLGINLDYTKAILTDHLKQFEYETKPIRVSETIKDISEHLETTLIETPEGKRFDSYMTAGNKARQKFGNDILAKLAIERINSLRNERKPLIKTAHVINSLKHPDELAYFKQIYGRGFYLLGISSSHTQRLDYLRKQKGIPEQEANALIERDESEEFDYGQHTRDLFHLSDGFVDMDADDVSEQFGRILNLIFGDPYKTPTKDEYAMFLAFASSLRSADLSRQVGAVVMSKTGEVISTGANDVPRSGGGLYWSDDGKFDRRDFRLYLEDEDDLSKVHGYDANEHRKNKIVINAMKNIYKDICEQLRPKATHDPDDRNNEINQIIKEIECDINNEENLLKKGRELLKNTKDMSVLDITEYGRAVHAEMEALLSCTRTGVSPRKGTLYCTTFPCHNCAKHIVAAGISRVVFVEPYPKSQALALHNDSIVFVHEIDTKKKSDKIRKVRFQPFVGIGPRKFLDFFSMKLSNGFDLQRKERDGKETRKWERSTASVRVPLRAQTYLENEYEAVRDLRERYSQFFGLKSVSKKGSNNKASKSF